MRSVIIALAYIGALSLAGCGSKPSIVGKWEMVSSGSVTVTNDLMDDGSWASDVGADKHARGTWALKGDLLTLTTTTCWSIDSSGTRHELPQESLSLPFKLSSDGRSVEIDKNGSKPVTWHRAG